MLNTLYYWISLLKVSQIIYFDILLKTFHTRSIYYGVVVNITVMFIFITGYCVGFYEIGKMILHKAIIVIIIIIANIMMHAKKKASFQYCNCTIVQ